MVIPLFSMRTIFFLVAMGACFYTRADVISVEQHRSVVARKIGHEILLMAGDSSSVVLPILREKNSYRIEFTAEFRFQPVPLANIVDSVLHDTRIHSPYLLEVISCEDQRVVYSYEVGGFTIDDSSAIVPCALREYEKGCYRIVLTFGQSEGGVARAIDQQKISDEPSNSNLGDGFVWLIFVVIGLVVLFTLAYRRRRRNYATLDHIINIGSYRFDKRNMHLTFRDETIELTSKEADLLFLLHSSANQTIERDTILRIVWGDDGDYVGRTLDVFISKLRKKLAEDPAIKIANIRGVGYRLVVDVPAG